MPTYRSITIALHSQFDIETLPEYHLPLPPPSTTHSSAIAPLAPTLPSTKTATDNSTRTVLIPVLPGSRFWLSYAVAPPVPVEWYFLFKMYVHGDCVVSWCTGQGEGWRGKVMFGLFDGAVGIERRVFCFGAGGAGGGMEVRVFRACGRRRVRREAGVQDRGVGGGVRLVNAGRAGSEQPKRFYKLALVDPIDQPFATFRYCCRSWEQLRELRLLDGEGWAGSEDGLSVIEPGEDCTEQNKVVGEDPARLYGDGDDISAHDWDVEAHEGKTNANTHKVKTNPRAASSWPRRNSFASGTYIPHGAPIAHSNGSPPPRRRGQLDNHRLSIPPPIQFVAPEPPSRPLPLPQKNDFSSSTAYRPHPAYPVEEWTMRTPSPVRSVREDIATPPLQRRKGLGITGAGLMGAIASSWKRGASAAQTAGKSVVREGARSVSY